MRLQQVAARPSEHPAQTWHDNHGHLCFTAVGYMRLMGTNHGLHAACALLDSCQVQIAHHWYLLLVLLGLYVAAIVEDALHILPTGFLTTSTTHCGGVEESAQQANCQEQSLLLHAELEGHLC